MGKILLIPQTIPSESGWSFTAKYTATNGEYVQSRRRVGAPWCCISVHHMDLLSVDQHRVRAHVPDNAFSGAQFGLGQFAALLVDQDNGEEQIAPL